MIYTCPPLWLAVLSMFVLAGCHSSYEPATREASPAEAVMPGAAEAPPQADDPHAGLFAADAADDPHAGLVAAAPAADLGPEVTAGAIRLTAPDGWVRKQPRSQFVEAEFALPKAEGDAADGRLTISLAGGSVTDNVSRWRDQFGGQPEKDAQQEMDLAGWKVTVVDFVGTYADQPGPFAPAVERPGYRMLAAIVPVGEQLHFIKAYGPQKTMTDHEDAFHAFLRSLKGKQ